ncbi:L-lysine 6-transaminase [Pelomyxa schiedti]|nr:L-lysine 6-transaminase [Pelomyxa schiedti]
MARVPLTRAQVDAITSANVHETIGRVMLADGFDFVVDFDKSHGNWLWDSRTGVELLDVFSYFASWAVGHNHPKMRDPAFVEKITRVALQNPSNSDIYSVEMAQFVATFERVLMPPEFSHVFFISGGALAVENAMKAAFDWKIRTNQAAGKPGKGNKIMHFKSAFHGRSGYTMCTTNTDPIKVMNFPKMDWPRIESPACIFPLEGENLARTIEAEKRALTLAEAYLAADGDDIAAVIIETIQGEGGDNHFRPEFMQALRALTLKYETMLIFDEVQCGCGLTGKTWAFQHLGVVPDMVCFGKKTQICGFMCTGRIDSVKDNVFHLPSRINSTWGGSLTDMVRSQKILEIIEEENLVHNAAEVGAYALTKLQAIQAAHPTVISNVRGKGLMIAFDLPNAELRNKFRSIAMDKKMVILACGSRSIRFRPALTTPKSDVDVCMRIIDEIATILGH